MTAIQTFLPIGLLIWLAVVPLESVVGRWLQLAATGFVLLALAWAGMWVLPPWWTPYLFGLLWIVACAKALMQWRSPRPFLPQQWKERTGAAVFLLLGSYAIVVAVDAHWCDHVGRFPRLPRKLGSIPPIRASEAGIK